MKKLFLLGAFVMASLSLSATNSNNLTLENSNLTVESNENEDLLPPTCYIVVTFMGRTYYVEVECPEVIIIIQQ